MLSMNIAIFARLQFYHSRLHPTLDCDRLRVGKCNDMMVVTTGKTYGGDIIPADLTFLVYLQSRSNNWNHHTGKQRAKKWTSDRFRMDKCLVWNGQVSVKSSCCSTIMLSYQSEKRGIVKTEKTIQEFDGYRIVTWPGMSIAEADKLVADRMRRQYARRLINWLFFRTV